MRRRIDADGWARHAAGANGFGDVTLYDVFAPHALPDPVYAAARRAHARAVGDGIVAAGRALARLVLRAYAGWQRRRAARDAYVALSDLDDRTLRDLGIDRSELTSVALEASGRIENTRAHVLAESFGVPH